MESVAKSNGASRLRRFIAGAAAIATGKAIGQIVTLFALPVLSRLYSPEQFGVVAFVSAYAAILVPIAILKLDQALVLPKRDEEVRPMLLVSVISLVVVAAVVGGLCALGLTIGTFDDTLRPFLTVSIPSLIVVSGLVMLLAQAAVRAQEYRSLGARETVQSLGITITQLLLVPLRYIQTFNMLVVGTVAGGILGIFALRKYWVNIFSEVSFRSVSNVLRKYWKFPLVFGPVTSLTLLLQQGPLLFVTAVYGVASGGQLGMTERITSVPLALVGLSIGTVLAGELALRIREGSGGLSRMFLRTSAVLTVMALTIAGVLFLAGKFLFPAFLGDDWSEAGVFAQAMCIAVASRLVVNPTRRVLTLIDRALASFVLELIRAFLLAAAILIALTTSADVVTAAWLLFCLPVGSDIATWAYCYIALKRHDVKPSEARDKSMDHQVLTEDSRKD